MRSRPAGLVAKARHTSAPARVADNLADSTLGQRIEFGSDGIRPKKKRERARRKGGSFFYPCFVKLAKSKRVQTATPAKVIRRTDESLEILSKDWDLLKHRGGLIYSGSLPVVVRGMLTINKRGQAKWG